MEDYKVIIRPLVTEQGMHFANVRGAYSFEVAGGINKAQVKKAIENLYNVKVRKVCTANRKGKSRRKGRNIGYTSTWKKAVVYLKGDDHIDLF
jgi:large subunit ribosomal protein L23